MLLFQPQRNSSPITTTTGSILILWTYILESLVACSKHIKRKIDIPLTIPIFNINIGLMTKFLCNSEDLDLSWIVLCNICHNLVRRLMEICWWVSWLDALWYILWAKDMFLWHLLLSYKLYQEIITKIVYLIYSMEFLTIYKHILDSVWPFWNKNKKNTGK